jgi:hypothetical protein
MIGSGFERPDIASCANFDMMLITGVPAEKVDWIFDGGV